MATLIIFSTSYCRLEELKRKKLISGIKRVLIKLESKNTVKEISNKGNLYQGDNY